MSGVPVGFRPSFDTCSQVTPLCPVEVTTYGDYFNLGASAFYTAFFALCLIAQVAICAKWRTWSFSIFLGIGTAFEVMGYGARISMSPIGTVWNYPAFVIQLLMLILAPTMVAAAISVTFKWIVIYLDPRYSVLRPRWYPWVFVGTDFISIIIQAVGGAVSASATSGDTPNQALLDVGSGLLVAGVAFQAANMAFCGGLMVIYWWRYRKGEKRGDVIRGARDEGVLSSRQDHEQERQASKVWPESDFQKYLYAIIIAYIAILIRCIYRIPEMALGWGSTLMQNETLFLILDGAMIALAVLCLTVVHPAIFFPILRKQKPLPTATGIDAEKADKSASTTGGNSTPTTAPTGTDQASIPPPAAEHAAAEGAVEQAGSVETIGQRYGQ